MLKKLLNILFTRFYTYYHKSGEKLDAQYTAILYIGLLLFINTYSLLSFVELLFFPQIEYSYYWLFSLQVLILISCYFAFIHKGKYKQIVEKHKQKNESNKYLEWFLIITYIILSVFVWVYLGSKLRMFHLQ